MHLYHCLALSVAVLATLQSLAESNSDRVMVPDSIDILSDEFIDYINNLNTTWKAGRNFDKNTSLDVIRGLMGFRRQNKGKSLPTQFHQITEIIPMNFDAREKWPNCSTIGQIRDQASCGACWAFGAVEAMSDRLCIATNGKVNVELSAEDLLTCCHKCSTTSDACAGGDLAPAWQYYVSDGIVSGGLYGTTGTCQPYQLKPCPLKNVNGHSLRVCSHTSKAPACSKKCQKGYSKSYSKDRHYGKSAYSISNDSAQIQKEIMLNGPVESGFKVYTDFIQYRKGVYKHHSGKVMGYHAIRILGWGVEDKVPYWLVANSWNVEWGDKGFFKILRGSNECEIENFVNAGLAKV